MQGLQGGTEMNRIYAAVIAIFVITIGCAYLPFPPPEGDGQQSFDQPIVPPFGTTPGGGGGSAGDGSGSGGDGDGGDGEGGDGGDGGSGTD